MADRMRIKLDVDDLHKRIDVTVAHPAVAAGFHRALDAWAPALGGLVIELEPCDEAEPKPKPKRRKSKPKTEEA